MYSGGIMNTYITLALIVIVSSLNTACGYMVARNQQISDELAPYVSKYRDYKEVAYGTRYFDKDLVAINITENMFDDTAVGECVVYNQKGSIGKTVEKEVKINRKHWNRFNKEALTKGQEWLEAARLQIVFHELGHCDLGRNHNDEKVPGTDVFVSLMSTYFIEGISKLTQIDEYATELFNPGYNIDLAEFPENEEAHTNNKMTNDSHEDHDCIVHAER
jgi:hypothetical protein